MPTYDETLQAMLAYAQSQTPELTDITPGSIFRSLYEALANELETLEYSALDRVATNLPESPYRLWSFERRTASAASGTVRLTATATISSAISIPSGTQVRVPGTDKVYRTLQAYTFPAGASGSTLDITVVSIGAGVIYNTTAATMKEFVSAPSSSLSVSNPLAFTNGLDEETDAERQARFASFIRSLHRATADSLEQAAEQATVVDSNGVVIERVKTARSVDISAGLARVYISNGSNVAASTALITAANTLVQAIKAAGVTIQVQAATLSTTTVTVSITRDASTSLAMVQTDIQERITALVAGLAIGGTLYREQIAATVLKVPGVIDVTVSAPVANVVPAANTQVVLSATPGVS